MKLEKILGAKIFGYDTYGNSDDLYFMDMELELEGSNKKKIVSMYDIFNDEYTPFKIENKSGVGFTSLTDFFNKSSYNPDNHWTTAVRFKNPIILESVEKHENEYVVILNSE